MATITRTTTKIAAGQPLSGMYTEGGGTCLDDSGTITKAEKNGIRYAVTVEFSNGIVREYFNVRPDGESDFTLPMGVCDGCGERGSIFGLEYRHDC